jgi:hypothetical protein
MGTQASLSSSVPYLLAHSFHHPRWRFYSWRNNYDNERALAHLLQVRLLPLELRLQGDHFVIL